MPKRNLILMVAVLAAAIVAMYVIRTTPPPPRPGAPAPPGPVDHTRRIIRENYYRQVTDDQLERGAVGGMVEALDEFSSYIPPDKVRAFRSRMSGKVCGLGVRIVADAGRIMVAGPLAGSPAHHAGVAPGDRILAVDDRPVTGLGIQSVQHLFDGPRGSTVRLELLRAGGRRQVVRLVREEFNIETVTGLARAPDGRWVWLVDPDDGLAYLRIEEFTRDTGQAFERVLRQLGQLTGVVLDLRDNPGGAKPAAIEVADMFLRNGPIVTVVSRSGRAERHVAHEAGTVPHVPVVVLVNSRTASAAELVAGALRARDRAVLVGQPTQAKACIQTMIPLGHDLGQINLTTAWFHFGPDEPVPLRPPGAAGSVRPHVLVTMPPPRRSELARLRAQALVLPPQRRGAETRPAAAPAGKHAAKFLKLDTQLARAVRLLKSPDEMGEILAQAAATRAAEQEARAEKARAEKAPATRQRPQPK